MPTLPPGSADGDGISLWSSRICLFQNTLKLPAGHWACVCCERRVFKLIPPETRTQQVTSMLQELEHKRVRAQPVPAEGSWARPPQDSRTHLGRGRAPVPVCTSTSPTQALRFGTQRVLEHLWKIIWNKTNQQRPLKLFVSALSSANNKQGVCTEVPANSCH